MAQEAPAAPAAPDAPAAPVAPEAPAAPDPDAPCPPTALFNSSTLLCNWFTRPSASAMARSLEVRWSACASACAAAPPWAWPEDRRTRSCGCEALATPVSPGLVTVPDAASWPLTTDGLAPAAAPMRAR